MRRPLRLGLVALVLVVGLAACSDDDEGDEGGPSTSASLSRTGVCEALDPSRASAVLGVAFDRSVPSEGTCTYTSSSSRTAFTVQVTGRTDDPALVLETMGASCDEGSRQDRTYPGADGGFSCLAGGVPNVVAAADGQVIVLTGNSRAEGVTAEMVVEDLATLVPEAIEGLAKS